MPSPQHSNETLVPGVGLSLVLSIHNSSAITILKDASFTVWCIHLNVLILVFGGVLGPAHPCGLQVGCGLSLKLETGSCCTLGASLRPKPNLLMQ